MNCCSFFLYSVALFTAAILFSFCFLGVLLKSSVVNLFCDKPDPRKIHSKPIPRIGGVAVIISFLLVLSIFVIVTKMNLITVHVSKNIIWALLLSSVVIFISGILDDSTFYILRVRHKLTAEIFIAISVVYFFNIHFGQISILNWHLVPLWVSKMVSVLWILGLINAFNMIDGIDGLVGGISFNSILALAVISYLTGSESTILICFVLAGAITGFLFYNMPPARAFMGDTGSLFLGTMVAVISMILSQQISGLRAIIIMPLIAGVPIIEISVTMVRRYFQARDKGYGQFSRFHSMVTPDNSHIHHRLIFRGFSHFETSVTICILSLILCCGAICVLLVPSYAIVPLLLYLSIPVIISLDGLGFGGRFKKALHLSNTRYNGFRKKSLIGVIDFEAAALHVLKKGTSSNVEYLSITEEQLPGISRYLKAVLLKKNGIDNSRYLNYAEQISVMVKGPIFIVSSESPFSQSVLEVYRNGSLKTKEKTGTINDLIKDLERCSCGAFKGENYYDSPVNVVVNDSGKTNV